MRVCVPDAAIACALFIITLSWTIPISFPGDRIYPVHATAGQGNPRWTVISAVLVFGAWSISVLTGSVRMFCDVVVIDNDAGALIY